VRHLLDFRLNTKRPNKTLQATAAALCALAVAMSHNAVVAAPTSDVGAAAVPGMCSKSYSAGGQAALQESAAADGE
jgi:hypothetical protein